MYIYIIYISVEGVPKSIQKYSRCNILFLYIASSRIPPPSSGRRHLHYIYTTWRFHGCYGNGGGDPWREKDNMLQTSSILSSLFFPLRSKGTNRCDRLISAPAHPLLLFFGDVRRMRARVTAKFKNKIKTIYLHTQS